MESDHHLVTPVVDFLAPSSRFASSSRLYGRLHRFQLLLRRFWWVVVLILTVVLVPVYLFTAEAPTAYESKARMWLTARVNLNEGRVYTDELIDFLATQSEVLRSSTVQQRALAKLRTQLTNDFSDHTATRRSAGFLPVKKAKALLGRLVGAAETNAPAEVFPFTLKVQEASKSSILELKAIGAEPVSTRAFLNCVMEEYFAFMKEDRARTSDRTRASITAEVRQLSESLQKQQAKLQAFQSSNNVVSLQEQGNSAGSYLATINRRLSILRTHFQLLQRLDPEQWVDVESRRAAGDAGESPEASARETLNNLAGPQAELFKASQQTQLLKAQRDELSRSLRPPHPKIIKLNQDIATQEKLVEISREEALRQLTTRRKSLQLEIANLESAFQEWDVKAIESSRKIADYDSLRLDFQRLQTAYDRLFGVMQTVDVGKTVDQESVGILESASAARPLPRMLLYMPIALIVALVLIAACLFCLGLFDDRFASMTELSDHLSAEVLGQIPAVHLRRAKGQPGIQYLERQRFEFLEAFRSIRSALLYMSNGKTRPKTVLVTSSVPREGKSTVALYLSATLALGNSKVLLIDGDMRQTTLHKFFGIERSPGLAEVLSREVSLARAILPSNIEKLSVLPAGTAKRNPGELVLSPEWGRCVEELHSQFDYIIIDSPPILATDDAASLASKVDGVMMVVRGSYTSARMAHHALNLLRQRQAHILGLVYNRALSSAAEYHYYHQYRQEYQWSPQERRSPTAVVCGANSPLTRDNPAN